MATPYIHLDAGDPQTPREVLLYTTIARLKQRIKELEEQLKEALSPVRES